MSNEDRVSRRASLKRLGAVGAAVVLGGSAASLRAETELPGGPAPDGAAGHQEGNVDVAGLAADRMAKGHS